MALFYAGRSGGGGKGENGKLSVSSQVEKGKVEILPMKVKIFTKSSRARSTLMGEWGCWCVCVCAGVGS